MFVSEYSFDSTALVTCSQGPFRYKSLVQYLRQLRIIWCKKVGVQRSKDELHPVFFFSNQQHIPGVNLNEYSQGKDVFTLGPVIVFMQDSCTLLNVPDVFLGITCIVSQRLILEYKSCKRDSWLKDSQSKVAYNKFSNYM